MLHKNLVLSERHPAHSYEYANSTARTSASGFTSADLGKIAWQQDNNTFWVLTTTTPTWIGFGSSAIWGSIAGSISDQSDLTTALAGKSGTAHNHIGVYEPADATILKSASIGISVASQSHNHTGVYEPTDATIIKQSSIHDSPVDGSTTAPISSNWAFDHVAGDNHGLYSLTNPTHSSVTYNNGGTTTVTLNGRNEIFSTTAVTGGTTWAFSGAAASGSVSAFTLELSNGGSQTQTWPASVKWDAGTAPALTSSGLDILTFYTRDNGTTWRGFLAAKDSK